MKDDTITISDVITRLVNGEEVRLRGLGTLRPKLMPARKGRNVRTGETVDIPERRAVGFKISSKLKAALNVAVIVAAVISPLSMTSQARAGDAGGWVYSDNITSRR